jgi:hypothetical protein
MGDKPRDNLTKGYNVRIQSENRTIHQNAFFSLKAGKSINYHSFSEDQRKRHFQRRSQRKAVPSHPRAENFRH